MGEVLVTNVAIARDHRKGNYLDFDKSLLFFLPLVLVEPTTFPISDNLNICYTVWLS